MSRKTTFKKQYVLKKFMPYMGNKKMLIPLSIILSLIAAVLSITPFYYIWKISSCILIRSDNVSMHEIKHYAFMVFTYSVLGILVYLLSIVSSHFAAFQVEIGIKKAGFEKIMNMPLGFFTLNSSGKMRKIINDGASSTHSFLAHQIPDIAGTFITPFLLLLMCCYFNFMLGIAAIIPVVLAIITMYTMVNKKSKRLQKEYINSLEEMSNESVEYIRAIPVVKTFGQTIKSFDKFYNSIEHYKKVVMSFSKMRSIPYSLYLVFLNAASFVLIPTAIFLIHKHTAINTVISHLIFFVLISPQIGFLVMKNLHYKQQKVMAEEAIDRFNALFEYPSINYPDTGKKFEEYDIEFKNVSFSYCEGENVVDDISFKINKGETLALVGASGSGKTTIARLLARFWDVDSGEILIGGKNIKDYSKKDLMNNISFVFQNNQLFKTTVRENISFGSGIVSDEKIEQAVIKSCSKEIIDSLDNGLNTVIGKESYLSGGEKQRICLARVFLKDAPIVLLDEATAFLDPENERVIHRVLQDLIKDKTTIMIAHKMTTVTEADKIAVLEKGKIIEYGNHKELISKNGVYTKMWNEYQSSIAWKV